MSSRKSFFDSPEWQAFLKPFKQFFSFFSADKKNTESSVVPAKRESQQLPQTKKPLSSKPKPKDLTAEEIAMREAETERIEVEKEKDREEFLLSKFEHRKLEREKRKKSLEGMEATVLEEDRTPLAEKVDFPQYTLEDFMQKEEESEEQEELRNFTLPEGGLKLPEINMLNPFPLKQQIDQEEIKHKMNLLQDTLDSFRIDAQVCGAEQGPRITRLEIRPAQGVNVDSISSLSKNIAMELAAESLRVLAPIPGKALVGVEIPNDNPEKVAFRELLESKEWQTTDAKIPLALGKNTSGDIRFLDLAKAPHLLIAGATGAGKSVCINTIIMSMIFRLSPEDLELILVDPKVVELTFYQDLPHLIAPVITDSKKVTQMLKWVVSEMKRRYKILALAGARNIEGYNTRPNKEVEILDEDEMPIPEKLPFMVIIIDELADIMMTSGLEVETSLAQIAQLSRAVGIHTIVATQRPSVNVITGIIKANYPTRIAFQVSSHVDSRTIIDGKGAEQLLGRGDMLYSPPGASNIERLQGSLVEDEEIDVCVKHLSQQMKPAYEPRLETIISGNFDHVDENSNSGNGVEDDDLIKEAIEIISRDRKASTSYLQRRLRIGYNRAATLMEKLEEMGIVGPQVGSAKREIFID
ncbi:MAG: DNA translocase FtsK [Lentisphaeraceae bacterium]|nr:DNA translocase FtsK [Lentisphaeraceae bacterium]